MLPRLQSTLTWTLLAALVGCQSQGTADEYLKITDMEPADAGGSSGCNISWTSTIYSGSQRKFIDPAVAPYFTNLDSPHATMPGVVSQYAARLWTTQPLDTTPEDKPSNGEATDGGAQPERLWGANLRLDLVQKDPTPCPLSSHSIDGGPGERPLDLSSYSGLVFWGKAETKAYAWPTDAGQPNHTMEHAIRVLVRDQYSDPRGKICTESSDIKDTPTKCWNAFSTTVELTDSFARYEVDFSTMWRDPTWGANPSPYALDLGNVYSIAFEVSAAKCSADQNALCAQEFPPLAFDFWIDDLYLVKHSR
jgi:hypothetical protein